MSNEEKAKLSGFSIGDPFIYFSKHTKGAYVTGVVESIMFITEVRGRKLDINVKKFIINKMYDHNEIFHYDLSPDKR